MCSAASGAGHASRNGLRYWIVMCCNSLSPAVPFEPASTPDLLRGDDERDKDNINVGAKMILGELNRFPSWLLFS